MLYHPSSALVAECLQTPGVLQIATLFLHSTNIQGEYILAQISLNFGDGSARCGNIDNCFNNFYISDEDAPIMRWLSPLEPSNRHQGVRKERFDGVGTWLLEMSQLWGSGDVVRVEPIRLSCFAPGIREWAKHI